jgi:hypothetical protein
MGGIYDLSVEIDPQVLANTGGVDAGSQIALNANFVAGTVASIGGATGVNDHNRLWRWQRMDDCGGRFAGRADAFDYGIQRRNCADIAGPGWAGGSECRCGSSELYCRCGGGVRASRFSERN